MNLTRNQWIVDALDEMSERGLARGADAVFEAAIIAVETGSSGVTDGRHPLHRVLVVAASVVTSASIIGALVWVSDSRNPQSVATEVSGGVREAALPVASNQHPLPESMSVVSLPLTVPDTERRLYARVQPDLDLAFVASVGSDQTILCWRTVAEEDCSAEYPASPMAISIRVQDQLLLLGGSSIEGSSHTDLPTEFQILLESGNVVLTQAIELDGVGLAFGRIDIPTAINIVNVSSR